MELQITEIEPVQAPKRKISEAAKKAQAKWRANHADKYREKCRQHSQVYYERHHEEVLERMRKRHANKKITSASGSEMSE
jgi:hypothetical protein